MNVLVTGASRGIGRATAELLAGRGDRVALVARDRAALDGVETSWSTLDMTGDDWPELVFTDDPSPGVGTTEWLVYPSCASM